jgi:C1A family cysteine protease
MKTRLFTVFIFVLGLALLLTWSAAAQGPEPSGPHQQKPESVVPPRPGSPGLGALPSSPILYPPKLPPGSPISAQALPASVDLTSQMPPVGDQGWQGSCVAWATGYYYKSFHEGVQHGWDLTDANHQFSPAFLYNQRLNSKCQIDSGWSVGSAMQMLQEKGDVSIASFPYDEDDTCTQPSLSQLQAAHAYRAADFGAFFINSRSNVGSYNNEITPLKQELANGNIVEFAIPVYGEFYSLDNLDPPGSCVMDVPSDPWDYGGHAIAIVGYDDTTQRFKLRNSWGMGWGCNGDAYLTYAFVQDYVHEAWWMKDFTTDTPSTVYLPQIGRNYSSVVEPGLYGQVTQNGSPVQSASIELIKWVDTGEYWYYYWIGKTYTDVAGMYRFSGLSTLGSNESYQVRYLNETRTPGRLWKFTCWNISAYTAGTNQRACDFDIADIPLGSPNGETVTLPETFYWTARVGYPDDDYEFNLYDKWGYDWWWTYPSLGYTDRYILNSLPDDFWPGDYYWDLWFYTPTGYGWTLGANRVTIN